MKISNIDLAFALMAAPYEAMPEEVRAHPKALTAFAQFLAERPKSPNANRTGLDLLDLEVPAESHREPMPEVEAGRDAVAAEIGRLNVEYDRSPLHARCALTRVAWACKALAWRLEYETRKQQESAILANRGIDRLFLRQVELKEPEWIAYKALITRYSPTNKAVHAYRPKGASRLPAAELLAPPPEPQP